MSNVTRLLEAANRGDRKAAEDLLPLVYNELRMLAAAKMAAEKPGHTLNPTALVHEAYLRLVGDQHFESHGHFFAAAAEAMRRILVNHARDCPLEETTRNPSGFCVSRLSSCVLHFRKIPHYSPTILSFS
jgi:RNA polymerase sigma factor (TIGR02999 family)